MNELAFAVFCACFVVTYSAELNSTWLNGKVLHPSSIGDSKLSIDIVTLIRKNSVFALGILVTNKILITAAHSIHDLPQPRNGGTRVLIKRNPYRSTRTYMIDYPIINSYDNPDHRKRGIDFAVLLLKEDVRFYSNRIDMPSTYVAANIPANLEVWETSTDPSCYRRTRSYGDPKLLLVVTISNIECADKLGHPIDDSLLCAVLPDYGGMISKELVTIIDGAPLTDGNSLLGITSSIRKDLSPPLMVFTRISVYASYINHEIRNESDKDGKESVWSSDSSQQCSDHE